MEHSQKVVVMPYNSEIAPPTLPVATDPNTQFSSLSTKQKQPKHHPLLEKLTSQIKIILKIAKIDGYDGNFRIKNESGVFIDNTNIINLLSNVTTPAKALLGHEPFVSLLYKAGVEPELISNENIRVKLIKLYETKATIPEQEPMIYTTVAPVQEKAIRVPVIRSGIKRTRDMVEENKEEEIEDSEIEPPL